LVVGVVVPPPWFCTMGPWCLVAMVVLMVVLGVVTGAQRRAPCPTQGQDAGDPDDRLAIHRVRLFRIHKVIPCHGALIAA